MTTSIQPVADAFRGRFVIERELGRGGMATVYLADDERHNRKVAIKVLHPDLAVAAGHSRFLREIEIAARLSHPNILPLFDSGDAAGLLYYVMPYVRGESLRDRLRREGRLAIDDALHIIRETADALQHAHDEGVVHRDVKPENILLASGHALVADFGIARALAAATDNANALTNTGVVLGTPAYMSPEQILGERVGAETDTFALGCVLYEMLTGDPPFVGPTAQATLARRFAAPTPKARSVRGDVPPHVDAAIARALARESGDRFRTVREFAVALAETRTTQNARDQGDRRSIAVLPFASIGGDADNEYFSDGITEDIITKLSKIASLKVISRTSVMRFKGTTLDMRAIAEALGVAAVLEGSVRRAGDRLRITAQLIDARVDEHLWAETFDRQLSDVFAIQTEVAEAIAVALSARLSPTETHQVRRVHTTDPETYRLCLLGRHCWNRWTEDDFNRSIEYYTQATERDPECAEAFSGLGMALAALGTGYWSVPGVHYASQARVALERALELDPDLLDANGWLAATVMQHDYDWMTAATKLERALSIAPSDAGAHDKYSWCLTATGRHDESRRESDRACELDPLSNFIHVNALLNAHRARDYARAYEMGQRAITLEPNLPVAHFLLSLTLVQLGRIDEASQAIELATSLGYAALSGPWAAIIAAADGRHDDSRRLIETHQERGGTTHLWPFAVAMAYATIGEADKAFEWLERAHDERDLWMMWLSVQPELDPIRGDPRFDDLLRRVRLA